MIEEFATAHPKIFVMIPMILGLVIAVAYLILMGALGLLAHGDPDSEYERWKAGEK